jgi:hypothetical protein
MRVFWAIIAVLALGAGLLWYLRPAAQDARAGTADLGAEPSTKQPEVRVVEHPKAKLGAELGGSNVAVIVPEKSPAPVPTSGTVTASKPTPPAPKVDASLSGPLTADRLLVWTTEVPAGMSVTDLVKPAPAGTKPATPPSSVKSAEAPKADAPKAPVAAKPETKPKTDGDLDGVGDPLPEGVVVPEVKPNSVAAAKSAAVAAPAGLNVKLEAQEDGSTLVDGKYVMKGAGTKEDPYRVTWEMLLSAEETYRPRLGKKVIPDRLKMIDGKWIRISGYIAFPVMASSGDEMLMMLNQWDGCCIGVPPTPYDAIEVKLKTAAKGNERLRQSGTLSGKFKIDPYLVKDWLISLYVMDDGDLTDAKGQANPGMHAGGGGP